MKIRNLFMLFVLCPVFRTAAVDLSVSPSSMVWTNQGWVNLSITNITPAAYMDIRLYLDINGDGIINGGDYAVALFEVDDGEISPVEAESFVDDNDGLTNGAVETAISCHGVAYNTLHTIGNYIWQAVELDEFDNPVGADTAAFAVTQPAGSVWISGEVRDNVTDELKPGAHIEIGYFSETSGLAPSVWADENGQFTIHVPQEVPASAVMGVQASVKGMMSTDMNPETEEEVSTHFFTNTLSAGANVLERPLFTVPAIEMYGLCSVSGTVYLVEPSEDGFETNLLRGVIVETESEGDDIETFAWDITDENGRFGLVVPGGAAQLQCESPLLNLRGIVGSYTDITVTGTTSGVEIYCYAADAMARARVTDKDTGEPLTGVSVYYESTDGSGLVSSGYTLTNGYYEICVKAGTWWAECDEDSLLYRHYLRPQDSNNLEIVQYTLFTNVPFAVEKGYIISGHVYDTNGTAVADGSVTAVRDMGDWEEWVSDADTSLSGAYSLLAPTGTVYVRTSGCGEYLVDLYYTNHYTANIDEADPLTVTTNGLSGIDFYLPYGARIQGTVFNQDMNPVQWLRVEAFAQNGAGEWTGIGAEYTGWGGEYSFVLPAATGVLIRTAIEYNQWLPRTWYGDTCSRDLAVPVALAELTTVSNLNIQVAPGYRVDGSVRDQNGLGGVAGAVITAFDAASNQYDSVTANASGDYWGFYVPTNVGLAFCAGAAGYQGEFYDNVYNPAEAAGVQTSAYNTVFISFVLYASGDDSDGDGLADFMEDTVPDGTFDSGADYADFNDPDTDRDGSGDGAEYIAGTGPQDGDSLFGISGGGVNSSKAYVVWSSVAGRQYTVQRSTNLVSGVWSNLYTVTATGDATAYTNSQPGSRAFYRVQVQAP